ncbi:hypothetical protein [Noviherbaspirillum saxi]|uniref:Uncharacterized protein n=1 Tax=Noviherbaspirillum saxi TaxID=2320863 RepID=A0A3A3FMU3_9BURK|nr:hypothetical protein [Noviherbaspirillum saxi]RJF92665.1 hypothetical protein D3871_29225 [Noviherbaspirillum saxi]
MNENPNILHLVKEVRHVYETEVNALLDQGWIILAVASGHEPTESQDNLPVFKYSLGFVPF